MAIFKKKKDFMDPALYRKCSKTPLYSIFFIKLLSWREVVWLKYFPDSILTCLHKGVVYKVPLRHPLCGGGGDDDIARAPTSSTTTAAQRVS